MFQSKNAGSGSSRLARRLVTSLRTLGPTLLVGLAVACLAAVLFSWLASEMLEGETQAFDNAVRGFIHKGARPLLTSMLGAVTLLGSTIVIIALSICAILVFVWLRMQHAAILFAITMAGAFILNAALKLSFQRPRPDPYFDLTVPTSYSFPSGHAIYSFCFYGTLAALMTARIHNHVVQVFIWLIAVLLIIMIGLSRVYLGVHYPSDVLGGYAASLVWVCTIALGDRLLHRKGEA